MSSGPNRSFKMAFTWSNALLESPENTVRWIHSYVPSVFNNTYATTNLTTNFGKSANSFGKQHADEMLVLLSWIFCCGPLILL